MSEHGEGPSFGARRPLRFMARRLDLDEQQVRTLARILDHLKTERAQARVDEQRSVGLIADALEGDVFGVDEVQKASELRKTSAARLADAVRDALEETHTMLSEEQRRELATLLRSGQLTI